MWNVCFQSGLTCDIFVNAILASLGDYESYLRELNLQNKSLAKKILQSIPENLYKTGNNKVFLKREALSYIAEIKKFKIKRAATLIQNKCKDFLCLVHDVEEQKQTIQNLENRNLGNIAVSTHIGFMSIAFYLFLRIVLQH